MVRAVLPVLLAICLSQAGSPARAQGPPGIPFPRLANMYWPVYVDSAIVANLAQWDVVVVNSVWTNEQLAALRSLNPQIRIYFYVIAYTVELPPAAGDSWKLGNYAYAAANDLWWYDRFGGIGSDWPNTQMCNITSQGPVGPQGSYRQFIAARIEELVATHPDLDGVFFDNFWEQLSWQQQFRQLDSDCNPTHNPAGCDGIADTNAELDSLWNDALRALAADVRARFDVLQQGRPRPLAILTNNATDYFESLNGAMVEYFPSGHYNVDYGNVYNYNWNQEMLTCPGGYLAAPFNDDPYVVQVLNGDYWGSLWQPARSPDFERLKRFTMVSALLGDGYYSLDAGAATGHGNLWWEKEYDHDGRGKGWLGQALGPAVRLLQPTGPEMLQNGDFAAGTSGWLGYPTGASGTFSTDATTFHSAPAAARIDVASVGPGGEFKVWQDPIPLQALQSYTLSFWARASTPQQILVHFYSENCPALRCWNDREFCVGPTWTRYEISFASTGTASAGLNLFVHEPGTLWLDDVSLRTGDTTLYRRDFENGVALLNYTNAEQTVDLGGTFWRMRIEGHPIFDGAPVLSEIVPPSDARLVMRDSVPPLPPDTSTTSDVAPPPGARNALWQNVPNPFNPTTEVRFSLARDERATLAVYDVAGRRVRRLFAGRATPGHVQRALWDGRDAQGRPVPSGIYIVRLESSSYRESRKMVLLR